MRITATRFHDLSLGHRVFGHESKCSHAHGHNLRIHFTCEADALDQVGRVLDFSVINSLLCMWLEENFDHRFLLWEKDPWLTQFKAMDPTVVSVPFNPTSELLAKYLLTVVGPLQLSGTNVRLVKVTVEETRKCHASAEIERSWL